MIYDRCISFDFEGAKKSKLSNQELAQNCKCTTPVFLKFLRQKLKEAMLNETSYKGRGSAFTDKDAFEAEIRTNCPSTVRWVEKKGNPLAGASDANICAGTKVQKGQYAAYRK